MKDLPPSAARDTPTPWADAFERAHQLHRAGELEAAERSYRAVLQQVPGHVGALSNLGVIMKARGKPERAVEFYQRAIAVDPRRPYLYGNMGNAFMALGQHDAAVTAFTAWISLTPDDPEARISLARGLRCLGRLEEGRRALEFVLAATPKCFGALDLLGEIHLARRDPTAAVSCLRRAAELDRNAARARHNLACAYNELSRMREAREEFEAAIRIAPGQFQSHTNLGDTLLQLEGIEAALPHYRKAVALAPNYANGWYGLGGALSRRGALEAAVCFARVLELEPDHLGALIWCLGDARKGGNLELAERHFQRIGDRLREGLSTIRDWRALANLAYSNIFDPLSSGTFAALTARLDEIFTQEARGRGPTISAGREQISREERIRIGYLSPNFRDHPVGHVTRSLFRNHRRERFEVHGFSTAFRPDHPSYTPEIQASFDHYHVLSGRSAVEAAEIIRTARIDILVDLDGFMDCSSPPILAHRPAPVQVYWLGHAGGLGLSFVDYLIADAIVVPPGEEQGYREQVVRLPDVYHCADRPEMAATLPSRRECGLPETGFVFCAFNNPQKIVAGTFDGWMRILLRVSDSCLWLSNPRGRPDLVDNLQSRAKRMGVAAERLVFARRVPGKSIHLARHRHAGLFLDTVGSLSASTTALDALWAGVPLLTVKGDRFASRIATTMLHGLGLDDLVCATLAEYEERAVAIASDPAEVARLAARVQEAKVTQPLFQTERFVRHLESAYEQMWAMHCTGQPPTAFDVTAAG